MVRWGTANNIQDPTRVEISEPSTWPEKALELVLAAKHWAPEGPQTWNDENVCAIIQFRHPELAFTNTVHLVRVWSWMCNPSHGNRFFGFKNEQYKRECLWNLQVTYKDIHNEKFRYCLRGTESKGESFESKPETRGRIGQEIDFPGSFGAA